MCLIEKMSNKVMFMAQYVGKVQQQGKQRLWATQISYESVTLTYDFPCPLLTLLRVANAMQHNVGLGDGWGKWVVKQMAARTAADGVYFLFCWRAKGLSSS